jgi:hypothetical protein
MQREIVKRSSAVRTAAVWVTPTIEVWFHILRNGSELSDGNVPAEWLTAQIGVLNAAFAGVFAFTLAGVTDTVSSEWNVLGVYTQQEFDAKAALRRGTWSTLNIYIAGAHGCVFRQTRTLCSNKPGFKACTDVDPKE